MSGSLRIGIVGGAGWLGGAIATSILEAGIIAPQNLSLSYRRERSGRFPDSFWTTDNQELADRADVIILSVRPQDWPAVSIDASGKLVVSVMAGIRLAALSAQHKTERVVRALPNAAAEVSCSYTPWIASNHVLEPDRAVIRQIFNASGVQDEVASEHDIDYLTGLTGSGPAFPALLAAAMMDHAVDHGLTRDVAERAVSTVLIGAGRLLERRQERPGDIVRTFLDYRGTTAAAINEMRASGFDAAVHKGLSAAFIKSVSMGKAP
ncbi:pyrroline-5-carboxylate reductase family protein [Rhizobium miluonense]|uniref:Pyrroline-5-carboxylate reductase n=1 Tax=Rhizobium miluonense TaxID=411945 RepID=A0A1C3VNF9_9HYPH|nr:pyrroline-5-carboxylate reductase dimerization domain-containing protein [Rhizobium miluonense]SCB29115.1 pyrroline-5-carboxylate reductase [Rhizobium miluonense]